MAGTEGTKQAPDEIGIDLPTAVRWMQMLRETIKAQTLVAHYEVSGNAVDIVVDDDGHTLFAGDEAVPMVHKDAKA